MASEAPAHRKWQCHQSTQCQQERATGNNHPGCLQQVPICSTKQSVCYAVVIRASSGALGMIIAYRRGRVCIRTCALQAAQAGQHTLYRLLWSNLSPVCVLCARNSSGSGAGESARGTGAGYMQSQVLVRTCHTCFQSFSEKSLRQELLLCCVTASSTPGICERGHSCLRGASCRMLRAGNAAITSHCGSGLRHRGANL